MGSVTDDMRATGGMDDAGDRVPVRSAPRRIVTGTDANGRSRIVQDGPATNISRLGDSGHAGYVLWATGDAAAPGDDPAPADRRFGFHSRNGTILRLSDFPPDEVCDPDTIYTLLDGNKVRDTDNPRHFWFHKTATLDYAIVLEGEIYAMLDEDETLMRAGDVLIQRATNHSWSNRSGKMCRMAFILIAEEGEDA